MSDANHADIVAGATTALSLLLTLSGVQSVVAIAASCLSALYFAVRLVREPSVKRFLEKIFRR